MNANVVKIESLKIGDKISYYDEGIYEDRVIEKHPFMNELIARSSYGSYMPLNNDTQTRYKYVIYKEVLEVL